MRRSISIIAVLFALALPARAQTLAGVVLDSASESLSSVRVWWSWIRPARVCPRRLPARMAGSASTFPPPVTTACGSAGSATHRASRSPLALAPSFRQAWWCDSPPLRFPLDTLIVVAAAAEKRPQFLVDAGFYRRQRVGFGHFLTRDEIDKRDPLILSDLLHGMSGVRVTCGGQQRDRAPQGPGSRCTVTMRAANTMCFRENATPASFSMVSCCSPAARLAVD